MEEKNKKKNTVRGMLQLCMSFPDLQKSSSQRRLGMAREEKGRAGQVKGRPSEGKGKGKGRLKNMGNLEKNHPQP